MFVKNNELHLVWNTDDVIYKAKERNIEITQKEAIECLNLILRRHDCEYGVNWDTIDDAIDTIVEERC